MEVYVITRDGVADRFVYSSLKAACVAAGVNYQSAVNKRTAWLLGDVLIRISRADVIKIKRGGFQR